MQNAVVRTLLPVLLMMAASAVIAQPVLEAKPTRGKVLYETHCIACHTAEMHWRDSKRATDWVSLKGLVRRWQATAGQFWNDEDIVEVARYLNEAYYRFPQSTDAVSWLAPDRR